MVFFGSRASPTKQKIQQIKAPRSEQAVKIDSGPLEAPPADLAPRCESETMTTDQHGAGCNMKPSNSPLGKNHICDIRNTPPGTRGEPDVQGEELELVPIGVCCMNLLLDYVLLLLVPRAWSGTVTHVLLIT